ncbi:hypothetical protein [Streptomyces sp. NPDC003077]|uniref:hypothetical protein n=1 Tax=Streptomyces sp. NPDC003077 TaxID=3154443 RepID=UPI0033A6C0BB
MTPDDELRTYVAACPVTPDLARRITGLIALPWGDEPEVTGAALTALGWTPPDGMPLDASFVTPQGHPIYGDFTFAMPFAQFYLVGGEIWPEDSWGTLPGWHSRPDADRAHFDAHVEACAGVFAEQLGSPACDVRTEGAESGDDGSWRYVAWRRGDAVLAIGQDLEGYSYGQDEEARVHIRPLPASEPLPAPDRFADFLRIH